MRSVLVTGGAGYIGSHTCKALASAGWQPVTYDNLSRGHADAVRWGPLEIGDIRDGGRLNQVLQQYRPACIVHFAALAYVGESVREPELYYDNNVRGSLSLLQAALRVTPVPLIVFSSSCATYGIPDRIPVDEETAQLPINPYGETKLVVERMLRAFEAAYSLRHCALRYFNAAGADPDGELGERHEPETHALPLIIAAGLGQGPAFSVFGTDYPTPDGTAIRDYVHVSDLAAAHVAAVDRLVAGAASSSVNLGTGRGSSVRELIQAVEVALQRPVPVQLLGRREGDPPALVARAERARAALGWQPARSELSQIVSDAVRWQSRGHASR